MQTVNLIFTVILIRFSIIDSARISFAGKHRNSSSHSSSMPPLGNFDPFETDLNPSTSNNDTHHLLVDQPSLHLIDDHPSEINETITNQTHNIPAGPSLDLIDAHPHSHDDDNASILGSAQHALIQPSIDFLDAQLHGGDDHVHQERNHTNDEEQEPAADLDDFQRWLQEQNQTDQLSRFLSLQKEMKRFRLDDTKELTDKLNRTIEELKSTRQRSKSDL